MNQKSEFKALLADLLEEEVLVLGGYLARHELRDELIWDVVRSFDLIRRRALARIEQVVFRREDEIKPDAKCSPHPAIEDFLHRIQEGRE